MNTDWPVVCKVFNDDSCSPVCLFLKGTPEAADKECGLILGRNPRPEDCPQFEVFKRLYFS